jgi:esterase/lipase superfamily enzyme
MSLPPRTCWFAAVLAAVVVGGSALLIAQRAEIRGRITDAAGAGVAGVSIELARGGSTSETTVTDERGEFVFPRVDLSLGSYDVRATMPGLTVGSASISRDTPRATATVGTYRMEVRALPLASAGPRPPPPAPSTDTHAIVPVFYATDRERATSVPLAYGAGRHPAEKLWLGRFDVSIPRQAHETGRIERPTVWSFWREDPDKHLVIVQRLEHTYDGFYDDVSQLVAKSSLKQAFVFIHGYNVEFDDAVYRTAQMAYDLDFDGAAMLYSWPSEGRLLGYANDANNAEWTSPHLRWFLEDVATKTQAQVIHVVAHSMGNRPLVAAMNRMAAESAASVRSRFRQVVLTAPDIDASTFRTLAAAMRGVGQRVTLYASSNDLALKASATFQGYQRAGDTQPSVVVVDGVDTIDVSALDTSLLGHSYFGDQRSVITDLYYLLRDGLDPARRAGLRTAGQPPNRYWVFKP